MVPSVALIILSVTSVGLSVVGDSFRRFDGPIRRSDYSFRHFDGTFLRWRFFPSLRWDLPSLEILSVASMVLSVAQIFFPSVWWDLPSLAVLSITLMILSTILEVLSVTSAFLSTISEVLSITHSSIRHFKSSIRYLIDFYTDHFI